MEQKKTLTFLYTTFSIWEKEQEYNSSEKLLTPLFSEMGSIFSKVYGCTQLPVDIHFATQRVLHAIEIIEPDIVLLGGMAESRKKLNVELRARNSEDETKEFFSTMDLQETIKDTDIQISSNAGQFVCEGLYANVLEYIEENKLQIPCAFLHTPLIENKEHQEEMTHDILQFLNNIKMIYS